MTGATPPAGERARGPALVDLDADADVIVIGAGMAGVSAGAALVGAGARVIVLESESRPGLHATGRSAALFTENYGNETVRRLTVASRAFLSRPPPGFTATPLLGPRGALYIGRTDQLPGLDALAQSGHDPVTSIGRVSTARARALCPALSPDYVAGAAWEPDAYDIDVDALLAGYLRSLRAGGGRLLTGVTLTEVRRRDRWELVTRRGIVRAPTVVNAAGAWADVVGACFGAEPLDLRPLRRTAFIFDPPGGEDPSRWPMVIDVDEAFYFKPEGGRLLGSPADETPSTPTDARPEEIDVALALDRIGTALGTELRHAHNPWAGLRTFAPDRTPVVGPDSAVDGFFWLAGQGGYGIQTAPAMAAAVTDLILTGRLPDALTEVRLTPEMLSPRRLGPGVGH